MVSTGLVKPTSAASITFVQNGSPFVATGNKVSGELFAGERLLSSKLRKSVYDSSKHEGINRPCSTLTIRQDHIGQNLFEGKKIHGKFIFLAEILSSWRFVAASAMVSCILERRLPEMFDAWMASGSSSSPQSTTRTKDSSIPGLSMIGTR